MFETIPVDIRTSALHGNFILLESFHFEHGELVVRIFAPGSGDCGELRFSDVVGFTMREDLYGPPARPAGYEEPKTDRQGFFQTAHASPMADTTRAAPEMGEHQHYRLQLREHELSFVASPNYQIKVEAETPALKEDTENAH
ncbi:hypothetical protein RXV86_04255 [Alisedimentitalea sp. MJ-SS2]|uniref:hypothetical protein n=1 Tax=Aliisedimentitalea sp. MJ-SS2 TaxID=3049795 RepID=UPI00290B4CB7|nr:hypothetical protein [Alisedimentitalea sp. MJ-SS2]MDU8926590.1 hypothetical protein [Alisedimentitalea sp. MJ-SS2]